MAVVVPCMYTLSKLLRAECLARRVIHNFGGRNLHPPLSSKPGTSGEPVAVLLLHRKGIIHTGAACASERSNETSRPQKHHLERDETNGEWVC